MKRAARGDENTPVVEEADSSKRVKSSNEVVVSQMSSTATAPEKRQHEVPVRRWELMQIYQTCSTPDNLDDPTAITRLRLRYKGRFSSSREYNDYPFHEFKIFSRLPRLTHISMRGVGGIFIEDAGAYHKIPTRVSQVTHMSLKKCQFGTTCLTKIIGFSDNCLEAFTYCTGGLVSPDSSGALISPASVWAMLYGSSKTLKKLDIDFDSQITLSSRWEGHEYDDPVVKFVQDVRKEVEIEGKRLEFPNLTCLRMGICSLMDLMVPPDGSLRLVDALPKGLEELVIRGYDQDQMSPWKSQIDEVKEKMAEKLPSLKILRGIDELIPNGEDVNRDSIDEDEYESENDKDDGSDWD